jgi:hypothetical protein
MATKVRDLSSDIHGTGESLQKYVDLDKNQTVIIDFDLNGLPSDT